MKHDAQACGLQIGAHLLEAEVTVLQPRELRDGKLLLHEQADLLDILRSHVLAQRLADRVGAGLGNGGENELVQRGDDHRPVNFAALFSRNAATPSR